MARPCMSGASRAVKLAREDEQRAEALYGRKWRQLRRWIERGLGNDDACPLLEPAKMPAWWSRNHKSRVPAEIEAAAIAASKAPPAAGTPSTPPPPDPPRAINLADYDPEDGGRLRQLKQLQAAKYNEMSNKLSVGSHDAELAVDKYVRLCDAIDKIESRVTERLKKRGLYILRDIVERDMAAAAELLRQSGDSLNRRVQERCPSLTAEQRLEVGAAIATAHESQTRNIHARLSSFATGDDLLRELAAA